MNSKSRRLVLLVTLLVSALAFIVTTAREDRPQGLYQEAWSEVSDLVRQKFGRETTCPVCGERSVFLSAGPKRPRARCGVCGSFARHRMLYLFLEQKTNLFKDELSVLHFSPNISLSRSLKAKKNLNYVTSEYDRPADLQLDLTDLAQPDDSWDVIICYHVFEHITEDRKAMGEMYRVLKPGGWATVQVPVRAEPDTLEDPSIRTPEEREQMYWRHDHVRLYGWKDFADRLEEAGFEVTIERLGQELGVDFREQHAVSETDRIYFLRKPLTASTSMADPEPSMALDTDSNKTATGV